MASFPYGLNNRILQAKIGKRCRQPRYALLPVAYDAAGLNQKRKPKKKDRLSAVPFLWLPLLDLNQ